MSKWMVHAKRADFKALAAKYNIDQVVARILVNRDVPETGMAQFLHPDISDLHDPALMMGAADAALRIADAINVGEYIRVIGDYDIDGICSTYILIKAIAKCGGTVDYVIPHRMNDGYGLNERLIRQAHDDGVNRIVTCDNGIAAYDEIQLAGELGMSVIVTDHHAVPYEDLSSDDGTLSDAADQAERSADSLSDKVSSDENADQDTALRKYVIPPADVVVNPHRIEDKYPFKDICGAVVAWKVVQLLYEHFGFTRGEAIDEFIEAAAFATIGDIMPLIDENRSIVKLGIEKIKHTKITGLNALIEQSGIDRDNLSTYHIGYVLGPCFNASGRLDTATLGVELLLEDDPTEAVKRAAQLVTLNNERKQMTETGTAEAFRIIEEEGLMNDPVIVVYIPSLHESLCGIVAGRVREKYYRPTFIICDGEEYAKGSGRSIEAYSMFEKMNECADLFVKFGGHPMAAGLTIEAEKIDELRRRLNEKSGLSEDDLTGKIMIDVPMPIDYIKLDLIKQINALEPFGPANEKPIFADKELSVCRITAIGSEHQYRKLVLKSAHGSTIDALYFGDGAEFEDRLRTVYKESEIEMARIGRPNPIRLSVVYEPQINSFRGTETAQIVIKEYQV